MGAGVPRDKSGSAFPSAEFLKIASKSSLATGNGKAGTKNHALYEACMHDFDNVDINHERGAISMLLRANIGYKNRKHLSRKSLF